MKKIQLTIAAILVFTLAGYSQFRKGSVLVGGNGSFNLGFMGDKTKNGSTTHKNYSETTFTINPQVGYFVVDNLAVGAGLTLSSYATKDTDTSVKTTSTDFLFSPFARYYYHKFYGQLEFDAGSNKYTYRTATNNESTSKSTVTGWSLAAGYALLLNDHVAIEPQIGYSVTSTKPSGSDTKDIYGGLFIRAGIYVYLYK